MPYYSFECPECLTQIDRIQGIDMESPKCDKCGAGMVKKPTCPAIIRIIGKGKYPVRSQAYKEGYSKEYLRDVSPKTQ
jgi:putative FmdB family regulatory protein